MIAEFFAQFPPSVDRLFFPYSATYKSVESTTIVAIGSPSFALCNCCNAKCLLAHMVCLNRCVLFRAAYPASAIWRLLTVPWDNLEFLSDMRPKSLS